MRWFMRPPDRLMLMSATLRLCQQIKRPRTYVTVNYERLMSKFVNTSAYKFVTLPTSTFPVLREQLKEKAHGCQLKGTILLSEEGINSFLSGTRENIDSYKDFLSTFSAFKGMVFRESLSDHQPFSRMLVRLKNEIISMGCPEIQPEKERAPYVTPETLCHWYQQKKDMILLDTRNDYEVKLGGFVGALDLNIETFRDFPNAITLLPDAIKTVPIVTYCTGGIRCEKAGQYMLNKGFKAVYQLQGGILNYFAHCGGDYWQGECFIFDKRVAVDLKLQETNTTQCYGCRGVLTVEDRDQPCPHCGKESDSLPT